MHQIPVLDSVRKSRIRSLYKADEQMALRSSQDNPEIRRIYAEFYEKPLGQLSEKLLHTSYFER